MGWYTVVSVQVHGPTIQVLQFQNLYSSWNTGYFYENDWIKLLKGRVYERIVAPSVSPHFHHWECSKNEQEMEKYLIDEKNEADNYQREYFTQKRNKSLPTIRVPISPVPSLYSIAAREISKNINHYEKDLHRIDSDILSFVFSHLSSSDLIRLQFPNQELNKVLENFINNSQMILFYLFEKRSGCREYENFKELSKKFPDICIHFQMWDDTNCDHRDFRGCIRKGDCLHERILYTHIPDPQKLMDVAVIDNRISPKNVCDTDYFKDTSLQKYITSQ